MLQFGHEGGIRHLRIVARDDQVAQPGDPRPIRYQDQPDAGLRRGPLQSGQIGGRNGAPVIQAARRLAQADGVEKRIGDGLMRPEREGERAAVAGFDLDLACPARRPRGYDQILGGAAQTDEQMMVVRVDNGGAAAPVGKQADRPLPTAKRQGWVLCPLAASVA
jgi:hypothetical protein